MPGIPSCQCQSERSPASVWAGDPPYLIFPLPSSQVASPPAPSSAPPRPGTCRVPSPTSLPTRIPGHPPHIIYSCFRSWRRVPAGVGATCEGAGGNIWLPSVLQGWDCPYLPQASSLWGGAEPQETRDLEVSTFALLTFRSPEACCPLT